MASVAVGAITTLIALWPHRVLADAPTLSVWLLTVVVVDMLPVNYSDHVLTMSVAVLLAAGMVLSPAEVGLLALLGSVDIREIRREIPAERGLFNRGQVALCSMAAAAVFHAVAGSALAWPQAILGALLAAATDATINLVFVSVALTLRDSRPPSYVLHYLFNEMLFSEPASRILDYLGLAILALLFAAAFLNVGTWGLIASLLPVVLVRQSFAQRRRSETAEAEAERATRLLSEFGDRVEHEKSDERARIAADLHDEVLPALFKVHLMGQVLKQDVDVGRLLDLDDDLPQLLDATDHAAARMRALIASLRRSSAQQGGVTPTLRLLVQELQRETSATIEFVSEDVGASSLVQLLIFQIAREALRNAIRHADASKIQVRLERDGLHARLTVTDDGKGFRLEEVDPAAHFGLALMADRARIAGGQVGIQSGEGQGTTVVVRVPLEAPMP